MAQGELIDWTAIEGYLKQGTNASLTLALFEYDKMVKNLFSKRNIPGLTFVNKIANAKMVLTDATSLEKARTLRDKIVEELDFTPERRDLELAINSYHQAVLDLSSSKADLSVFRRAMQLVKFYLFSKKTAIYKKTGGVILGFFAFVYFLGGTAWGVNFSQGVVSVINTVFTWLLFLLVFAGATIFLIALTLVYFDKRKRIHISKEG